MGAVPAAGCRGCYNDYVDRDGIIVPQRPLCPGDEVNISESWTSWMESGYEDPDPKAGLRIAGLDGLLADEDRKLRKESERKRPVAALERSGSFYRSSSFYAQKSSGVSTLRASTFNIGQGPKAVPDQQRAATFNGGSFLMDGGLPQSLRNINLQGMYGLLPRDTTFAVAARKM
eukprot:gnl/MRDRNA2_/MRDRNA2_80156_c2_seq1.p1 gnl/MRDRNA2_/MRDRNA2_80156_c2~~gnl/MRDRNA2_/MRDRNA2_80156_c2_seq1.p1  ORF type:complete len:174 (+),score=23.24 gnl/MRDRNA2_/MRDRNA2_80156_c2_seq1:77-598(+)